MYSRLELLPNELLFYIFEYLDTRDLFYGFWGLNQRFNQLLQSLEKLSLTIEKDESKLISLFGCQIHRLVVDTCLDINFSKFPYLHSLILHDVTEVHLKQFLIICMPHLVYLSIPSDNISWTVPRLIQKIFSHELSSLHIVNLVCPQLSFSFSSQSNSLRSVSIYCTSSIMVLHILSKCPNLCNLRVHFEENNCNVWQIRPLIVNHSLKYFILSDPFSVLCLNHIDTFLKYMPNVQRIQLNFNCNVPFIHLAELVSNRLSYLRRFDCHIDITTDDDFTSLATIQRMHPCFYRIQCITDDYGYRTYSTN
jgi:hypothetical protein